MRHVLCADVVAESAFLCEYYLQFRGVGDRAQMILLPDIEAAVTRIKPQLAISIHCMDECSFEAACWWIGLLRRKSVRYLMIVVNSSAQDGDRLLGVEPNGERKDFAKAIAQAGYRVICREPKYSDPLLQKFGVSPSQYSLFELQ